MSFVSLVSFPVAQKLYPAKTNMKRHGFAANSLQDSFIYQTRQPGHSSCRFAGDRGGTDFDRLQFNSSLEKWLPIVKNLVEEWDHKAFGEQYPQVKSVYEAMGLGNYTGIPPLMGVKTGDGKTVDTRAILGLLIFKMVETLNGRASCLEEAVAQIDLVFDHVRAKARKKVPEGVPSALAGDLEFNRDSNSNAFPTIRGIGLALYSIQYKGHIVFVGKNGAIQALRMPTPLQVAAMIKNDDGAKAYIESQHPLGRHNTSHPFTTHLPPFAWDTTDADGTIAILGELAQGKHPQRNSPNGITDIHTLTYCVPFDYGKAIKAGILVPITDIPGSDGRTVWDTVDMKAIQSPKRYAGWGNI